jgi:hypothetical protein
VLNVQYWVFGFLFDVGRSMFDVGRSSFKPIPNSGIFDITKFGQLFKEKGLFGKEVQGPRG